MDRLKQHGYRFAGEHTDNKPRPDALFGTPPADAG